MVAWIGCCARHLADLLLSALSKQPPAARKQLFVGLEASRQASGGNAWHSCMHLNRAEIACFTKQDAPFFAVQPQAEEEEEDKDEEEEHENDHNSQQGRPNEAHDLHGSPRAVCQAGPYQRICTAVRAARLKTGMPRCQRVRCRAKFME